MISQGRIALSSLDCALYKQSSREEERHECDMLWCVGDSSGCESSGCCAHSLGEASTRRREGSPCSVSPSQELIYEHVFVSAASHGSEMPLCSEMLLLPLSPDCCMSLLHCNLRSF